MRLFFLLFLLLLSSSVSSQLNISIPLGAQDQSEQKTSNLNSSFDDTYIETYSSESDSVSSDTSKVMNKLNDVNEFMEWYMKYFPVPFGSYSAETSWLFGLSKYNAFKMRKGDLNDTITQASSLSLFAYVTLKDQYKIVLESNLMFNKNKAQWKTDFIYTVYPLEFFGLGNETNIKNQRTLNTSDFQFSSFYQFKIWKKWYLGPEYDFYNYYDVELAEHSVPIPGDSAIFAHNIGIQSGLGIKLSKEGRDNRFNARSGYYVDIAYQVFDHAFGSEYDYNYFKADIRYYVTPFDFLTIAMQARTESKKGDVPVQSLALLGGDYSMRGIYLGRYRDKVLLDTQVELRFPIFWIISGVAFGGLGQVAPDYDQLNLDAFHYTYGAGLRLMVDSEHRVNMRFDLGFSEDQTIFIMQFSEAF